MSTRVEIRPDVIAEWWRDCLYWRGRLLMGRRCHWCADWDDLPMDETCPEWPCYCAEYEDHENARTT